MDKFNNRFCLIGVILLYGFTSRARIQVFNTTATNSATVSGYNKKDMADTSKTVIQPKADTLQANTKTIEKHGILFSKFEKGEDKVIMIETDKYYAEFSTKGGSIIKYEVKGFNTWDGFPVQLLRLNKGAELNILFTSAEGKLINTKDLYFNSGYKCKG
jgi:hypothetical protein